MTTFHIDERRYSASPGSYLCFKDIDMKNITYDIEH